MMDNKIPEINTSIPEQFRLFIWEQGFALGSIQGEVIIQDFIQQMDKPNKKNSSLAMLPSFLHMPEGLQTEKKIIAIDAGGSNLRCALISFSLNEINSEEYQYTIEKESHHAMPGTEGKLSASEFFEELYAFIEPKLEFSDTIGFCFSYPCEISEQLDGKLLRWTKEVNAPEVEKLWIAQELNQLIKNKGKAQKKIILLNDTVSTLLSSKLKNNKSKINSHYHAHIGLILGTGTNCAFTETTQQEVINIESGAYDGIKNTLSDKVLDSNSLNSNEYAFEKKIAGRYLGSLCLALLNIAASQTLFSGNCCQSIQSFSRINKNILHTERLNELLGETTENHIFKTTDNDLQAIHFLINAVIERAALFSALQLFAISKKILLDLNLAEAQCLHVDISIEGSTYYQLKGYQAKIEKKLKKLMSEQGISYQLLQTDNASLLGAAIAAASAK